MYDSSGLDIENHFSEKIFNVTDYICCIPYWRPRWLFNDWKSTARYYLMVFFWLVLILGFSGLVGYYTEVGIMAYYWLPISASLVGVSLLYIIWYFYVDWRLAPDLCCMC